VDGEPLTNIVDINGCSLKDYKLTGSITISSVAPKIPENCEKCKVPSAARAYRK
jgi:hypothetical protein